MSRMNKTEEKLEAHKKDLERYAVWTWYLHGLAIVILGVSLFPMVFLLWGVWKLLAFQPIWLKILAFSFTLPFSYFVFGTTLIFACMFAKNICGFKIAPGLYRMYSKESLLWMGYNSLILIANAAFLDVLRLSPFQALFYRNMGAKIGNGVNINTGGLADLSMLEIGDNVLVGGGVALICHASDRGFLRLESTKIANNVSIGLSSVIMPGCEIGEGASIAPCSYVPKGTKIPPKSVWGGNPVRDLREEKRLARPATT